MAAPRKLTEEQAQEIIDMYVSGSKLRDIYEKYNHIASSTTISRLIRKSGIVLRKAGPKRSNCLECQNEVYRGKLCRRHYRNMLAEAKGNCNIEECASLQYAKGMCSMHYQRMVNNQPLIKDLAVWVNANGYWCEYSPGHVQANKDGRVLQHRKVMAEYMGRRLESYENVHHINGDRRDNRLSNLELWVKSQPAGQRVEDLIDWAEEILRKYKNGS